MLSIVKRKKAGNAALIRVFSIGIALIVGALVILLLGYNPAEIYREIAAGALGSAYNLKEVVRTAVPLLLMALGVTLCFRLQFFNIGAEGQFYMGATAASAVALNFPDLPAPLLITLMFLAAVIGGGLWCAVPALLKLRLGTNETLVTLMLNYIAVKIVAYLQFGPWKDPDSMGYPTIPMFSDNAVLPRLFGIHIGWVIAAVLFIVVLLLLTRTKAGYQISVTGENPETARYAGFSTAWILLITVALGGGLCGVAGFIQASAIEGSLTYTLSSGWGYTAIIVAWLGKLKSLPVLVATLAIAILLQGCAYIQISLSVPYFMANIIQGVILFFVLASEFFAEYQIVRARNEKGAA
jgi:simple sugar transport system permease protein